MGSKKENIIPWFEFFYKTLLKQSQIAVDLLSRENIEKLLTPKQMKVWQYLQEAEIPVVPMIIAKETEIAQPTVRQALDKLMRLKRIERIGQGRSTEYKKL